ncbi:hypothetical protein O3P69_010202 [Scylla paramamosain]|uniref:Uncharacterized protein n=1 Tax=Scylla paramamosain TaxID=85552 RepID=A0AAW0TSJ5_SCYPA
MQIASGHARLDYNNSTPSTASTTTPILLVDGAREEDGREGGKDKRRRRELQREGGTGRCTRHFVDSFRVGVLWETQPRLPLPGLQVCYYDKEQWEVCGAERSSSSSSSSSSSGGEVSGERAVGGLGGGRAGGRKRQG